MTAIRSSPEKFRQTLRASGVRCLKMPRNSPNLNAYAERFVRSIRQECLSKMIFIGEKHVRYVVEQYLEHYNQERPHQGIGNRKIDGPESPPLLEGPVHCRERLGGLLKTYYREAA